MRAFLVLLFVISLPVLAGEQLRLESHVEITEKYGTEVNRRIEGFDQQKRRRLVVAEYKNFTGYYEPRISHMISIKHPEVESWQSQPLTKEEYDSVSAALLSTPKNAFLGSFTAGCRADIKIGDRRLLVSVTRACPPQ